MILDWFSKLFLFTRYLVKWLKIRKIRKHKQHPMQSTKVHEAMVDQVMDGVMGVINNTSEYTCFKKINKVLK